MRVCRWSLLPKYFVLIILEFIVRGDCQIPLREKLHNPIKLWMIIITHSTDYPYFRPKKKNMSYVDNWWAYYFGTLYLIEVSAVRFEIRYQ